MIIFIVVTRNNYILFFLESLFGITKATIALKTWISNTYFYKFTLSPDRILKALDDNCN